MCGIAAFFARESTIDYKHLDTLFSGAEKRGQDGFGICVIKKEIKRKITYVFKDPDPYSKCKDKVKKFIQKCELGIGDLIMAIARAAPETEPATDKMRVNETLQPIINYNEGLVVVHNGAVSQVIYDEIKNYYKKLSSQDQHYEYQTDIDSEAIAAAYVANGRNMKKTMEYLSGGFAFIMYDQNKDMLYVVNDHMQLSHGYIRGLGFFLHSDNNIIGQVINDYLGATRDGMFLWENFYHHYLDGHNIREIDLQSGFMRKEKYTPRYITPTFDSINGVVKDLKNDTI